MTRSLFEKIADSLIQRCLEPCKKAISDAGLSVSELNDVILVGGSTRIPAVQKIVEDYFGKKPSQEVNPDEVVAVGAAIQGGVFSGDVKDVLLLDVTPLSLGIETMGNVCTKLIESNTTIPTKKSEVFSTAADNQPAVDIHVLQGERPMASDNKTIGRFQLTDLPAAPRGTPQIEVTFDIDANGIINVKAKDKNTGKEQSIKIESGSKLSEEEIQKMKDEAQANADADKKAKEYADKMNTADGLIFNTEKQLKENGDKIPKDKKKEIEGVLSNLKKAHSEKNIEEIDKQIDLLNGMWQKASQDMYQNTAKPNSSTNNKKSSKKEKSKEENVTDVDFEEVDDNKKE